MIGIAICTHADFAQGLKNACEMIAGKQENLKAFCFDGDEEITEFGNRINEQTKEFSDGCVYVTDILNATPFNAALMAVAYTQNVILCGASLPMVLELVIKRNGYEGTARDLAKEIMASSGDYCAMRVSEDVFK